MIGILSIVVTALAVGIATGAAVLAVMDRRINWPLLGALGVLELALLVQLVAGIASLVSTDRDIAAAIFIAYLVSLVLAVPLGAVWALAEPGRWGVGTLAVVCLVVPVLVLRLEVIWTAG